MESTHLFQSRSFRMILNPGGSSQAESGRTQLRPRHNSELTCRLPKFMNLIHSVVGTQTQVPPDLFPLYQTISCCPHLLPFVSVIGSMMKSLLLYLLLESSSFSGIKKGQTRYFFYSQLVPKKQMAVAWGHQEPSGVGNVRNHPPCVQRNSRGALKASTAYVMCP